ncbi:MAG: heme exporter protein CcmB [Alphaproteobacteria bacterium]|nr:heme exporter protein CcmB [Alphaproteobacteria bacterium]MBE8220374.1 heme exporter protein CcmB [Alphaproteobacteria bacterium]
MHASFTTTLKIGSALAHQHIKTSWRGGYILLSLGFLFIAIILLPFGVGAELLLLQKIAPGLLWVALLMTLLLSLEHLFQSDKEDGSFDQLFLLPIAPELAIAAKLVGHFIAMIVPLLIAIPLAGVLLNLAPAQLPPLWLAMLAGAPALTFLGGLGAALSLTSKGGALLTTLLLMPFYVPIIIIGVFAEGGDPIPLLILASISLAACLLTPFAMIAVLRPPLLHGVAYKDKENENE